VAEDAVPQPVSAAITNRQSAEAKQPVNLDGHIPCHGVTLKIQTLSPRVQDSREAYSKAEFLWQFPAGGAVRKACTILPKFFVDLAT
jgi:hypothetical protein